MYRFVNKYRGNKHSRPNHLGWKNYTFDVVRKDERSIWASEHPIIIRCARSVCMFFSLCSMRISIFIFRFKFNTISRAGESFTCKFLLSESHSFFHHDGLALQISLCRPLQQPTKKNIHNGCGSKYRAKYTQLIK